MPAVIKSGGCHEWICAAGETHYDRFATALANAYGDDATDADIRRLVALAERRGAAPLLPGGQCPVTFAAMSAE